MKDDDDEVVSVLPGGGPYVLVFTRKGQVYEMLYRSALNFVETKLISQNIMKAGCVKISDIPLHQSPARG